MAVDYTLYLVTDSTPAILGDRDICDVVDGAIRGGVTIVQYRDKTSDTGDLVATAKRLHAVTQKHGVPLLINDRVDVALAVGCEGVHLGQDDMDIGTARKLLGPSKIIGITANTAQEAITACQQGADYLGIGTVFSTQTRTNTKTVIGPDGLRDILLTLAEEGHGGVPTVCIGGINASNIPQVMFRGSAPSNPLDGVAVVSAIVAAEDPEEASRLLLGLVRDAAHRNVNIRPGMGPTPAESKTQLLEMVPVAIKAVHEQKPLSHNMTNLVVQNFAANVALSIGASPIMANYGEEAADLASLGGALVINMGTVTPEGLENYKKALSAYNAAGRPVVFDPVGAGATAVRRAAVKSILSAGYIDVIKGNESEIKTVYASGSGEKTPESQRGVDSSSTLSSKEKAELVKALARREQAIVVMTGKTDILSDGKRVVAVGNGHEYLGMITGTGCTLGTTISAMVAACPVDGDRLVFVVAGILLFEIAAEIAAAKGGVEGPGTFVPAFLDSLYAVRTRTAAGDLEWLAAEQITLYGDSQVPTKAVIL